MVIVNGVGGNDSKIVDGNHLNCKDYYSQEMETLNVLLEAQFYYHQVDPTEEYQKCGNQKIAEGFCRLFC